MNSWTSFVNNHTLVDLDLQHNCLAPAVDDDYIIVYT